MYVNFKENVDFKSKCMMAVKREAETIPQVVLDRYNDHKFTPAEIYVARLWMTNEVNNYSLCDRWYAKEINFQDDDYSLAVALTYPTTIWRSRGASYDMLPSVAEKLFNDVVDIVQLHEYVTRESMYSKRGVNKYTNMLSIVKHEESKIDHRVVCRESSSAIAAVGLLASVITGDFVNSTEKMKQIQILATKMIYTFILRAYGRCALPMVIYRGVIHELPYDIIYQMLVTLNDILNYYDVAFLSPSDVKYKNIKKAYKIVRSKISIGFNIVGYDKDDVDKVVDEIIKSKVSGLEIFKSMMSAIISE